MAMSDELRSPKYSRDDLAEARKRWLSEAKDDPQELLRDGEVGAKTLVTCLVEFGLHLAELRQFDLLGERKASERRTHRHRIHGSLAPVSSRAGRAEARQGPMTGRDLVVELRRQLAISARLSVSRP